MKELLRAIQKRRNKLFSFANNSDLFSEKERDTFRTMENELALISNAIVQEDFDSITTIFHN